MRQPVSGDIFAVHHPETGEYSVYQFLRYHECEGDSSVSTDILPDRATYASRQGIKLDQLQMDIPRGIERHLGYVPADHEWIGHLPLFDSGRTRGFMNKDLNGFRRIAKEDPNSLTKLLLGKDFDLADLADDWPQLRRLNLNNGYLHNFADLQKLHELRSLTLCGNDLADETLPDLRCLPHLNYVHIRGFPQKPGNILKKQLQALAKERPQRLSYKISELRTPLWYAANRYNPMAVFKDRPHIPAKEAKAAFRQYQHTLKAALALPADGLQQSLAKLAPEYASAFNGFGWIATTERETICEAFHQIARMAGDKRGAQLDAQALQAALDQARLW